MQKNLKRFMAIVLTIVMTITAVPLTGIEAKAAAEYKYGNYYYYPQGTQFVSSIRYGQDEKYEDATEEAKLDNHYFVNVDLNSGISGSDYIYLGYKTSTDINDAVATYFTATHSADMNFGSSAQITINNKTYSFTATALDTSGMQDLNATVGGDYIYLYASKDAALGLPVTSITASASSDSAVQPPSGYVTVKKTDETANETTVDSECNAEANGDYVYIYYDNTSAYTDVTEEILALKEKIEAAENLKQSDYTAVSIWLASRPHILE